MADWKLAAAEEASAHVNRLAGRAVAEPRQLDASDHGAMVELLRDADGALSALPYMLNPAAAKAAIEAKTHFADLGGNSAISAQILAMDREARGAGVTLVPDCGLVPGLSATMTAHLMERFEEPRSIRLRCGGLPQNPVGTLKYQLVFSIVGLVEGILYLVKTDEDFEATYIKGHKGWF